MPTSVLGTARLWWHISHPWMACTSLRKGQALKLWDLRLPFGWWWSWHWLKGCSLGTTCVVTIKSFVQHSFYYLWRASWPFKKPFWRGETQNRVARFSWQRSMWTMPFRIRTLICLQVNRIPSSTSFCYTQSAILLQQNSRLFELLQVKPLMLHKSCLI